MHNLFNTINEAMNVRFHGVFAGVAAIPDCIPLA